MAGRLDGRVAVVTGSASGIGLATTKLFLAEGATVFGIDRAAFPESTALPDDMQERFHFHRADLTAASACDEAVAACLRATGSDAVDILANVAGVMDSFEAAHKVQDATWERVFSVNTTVPMRLMRAVLNEGGMLKRKSGRIINVASKAGMSGATAGIAYTASKHALIGMTKQAAWIYRLEGITVNAVCPGGVATRIGASINQDNLDQESLALLRPFQRLNWVREGSTGIGEDDVAHAILFLSQAESRNINGVIVPVDNAWSAC